MEQYINAAENLGLKVIRDGSAVLIKGLDWISKPITHEAHFRNTLLKTLKNKGPELRQSLSSLRKLMKSKPTVPVKIAYKNVSETVRTLIKLFPEVKF